VTLDHIDRAKHAVDILEHVTKGVQARETYRRSAPDVIDVHINPWLGGYVISAVQFLDFDGDAPE
jgi:hypothetical protein